MPALLKPVRVSRTIRRSSTQPLAAAALLIVDERNRELGRSNVVVKPETVGMSSSRLAKLDEVMASRYVDGGFLPGILTQVYRKGHLVHTGMAGHMDLERAKGSLEHPGDAAAHQFAAGEHGDRDGSGRAA